jgi:hypothetical protein
MDSSAGSLAEYFDGWYADMTGSPVKDEIEQRHLGLPPHLLSTSLLNWDGIAEVTAALRLAPGGTLVDLPCGRGGYGLEIAARTVARTLTGGPASAPCGKKPPRSTPGTTRPCAPSTTRACAPWRPSGWSAASWPSPPAPERAASTGGRR